MTERITQESNPILWAALHSSYISEGKAGYVVRGSAMYKAYTAVTEEVVFERVDTMDLIDSRSLRGSKKATYNKLKE